jgi:hypothetical protein
VLDTPSTKKTNCNGAGQVEAYLIALHKSGILPLWALLIIIIIQNRAGIEILPIGNVISAIFESVM